MTSRITVKATGRTRNIEGPGCQLILEDVFTEDQAEAACDGMQEVLDYVYGCGTHTVEHTEA